MSKNDHLVMEYEHMDKLYNSKNSLVRFVLNQRLEHISKLIPPKNNLKILDAGCGEGHLLEVLIKKKKENNYIGIDITDVALDLAKKKVPSATFLKKDLSTTKFKDESFDIIICSDVLEHIIDFKPVILELKRILKKGGYLIISFPNETLWTFSRILLGRRPIKVPDHVNSFTPNKMKKYVKLKHIITKRLPFHLPYFSLTYILKFKKI